LAELDGVDLVAVTDVDGDRAQALADEHDARAHPTQADLLGAETIDAIWLCVPPFAHGEPERLAMEAGIPFFVEKPLGTDLAAAEDIARALESSGLPTATGYHWRGMPGVERAAEALAGAPVRLATGAWLDKVPPVAWWLSRAGSGGQLNEQATHLIDVMRALVGEPVRVHAAAAHVADRDPGLVDPATAALLSFDTGAVATLSATSALTWKQSAGLTLVADGLSIEIGESQTVLRWSDHVEEVTDDGMAKVRVDAEFCQAVRSGDAGVVRVPYAEALRTHRVGIALTESASSGEPVDLRGTE
jgi:predicted dehydrogenase